MRKLPLRLSAALVLFFVSAVLFLGLFYSVRQAGRTENFRDTEASFSVIVGLVGDGASSGYFQWTELRNALAARDLNQVEGWLDELKSGMRFIRRAVIEVGPPPQPPYRITGSSTTLRLEFPVTDSQGNDALADRFAALDLDAATMLEVVQSAPGLVLSDGGLPFFGPLKASATVPPLALTDYLISGVLAFVAALALWTAFRREDRFFYESKGLDTIIFLFENTEQYSAFHSRHVAELSESLGRRMGYRGKRLKDLKAAALLHDIGKIAVPREILTKPGRLTEEEMTLIRTHADASARILCYFNELAHLAPVVRSHHEKMDGTGYPQGLRGDQIPQESRIIAVADVFEALTGKRPYREPFDEDRALATIRDMSLDPDVVVSLAELLKDRPSRPVFSRR